MPCAWIEITKLVTPNVNIQYKYYGHLRPESILSHTASNT